MIGHDEQTDRVSALEQEVEQLRRAMESHALIDQAIGVIVTVGRLRPEQGWDALRHISQHTNVKLREVARALVRWPADGRLPDAVRRALPAAVQYARDLHQDDRPDENGPEPEAALCGRTP